MDRAKESQEIRQAVIDGKFTLKEHAKDRKKQRELSIEEIQNVAKTMIHWEWQETEQTHLFIGWRNDKKGGGFSAKFEPETGTWVVTVFKRTLKNWQREQKK